MVRSIVNLGLSPLWLAQALYVRGTTVKLPEPPGARSGRAGAGPPLRLLILGDSAAAGVGVESQRQALSGQLSAQLRSDFSVQWRLLARTGDTTRDAIDRLQQSPVRPFDVVMCSLGVNDVTSGRGIERWRTELDELHTLLRERFGVRLALFAALPPMQQFPALPRPLRTVLGQRAAELDQCLRDWTAAAPDRTRLEFENGLDPAHMARDGFHPGAPIYAGVARVAAAEIRRRFLGMAGMG